MPTPLKKSELNSIDISNKEIEEVREKLGRDIERPSKYTCVAEIAWL